MCKCKEKRRQTVSFNFSFFVNPLERKIGRRPTNTGNLRILFKLAFAVACRTLRNTYTICQNHTVNVITLSNSVEQSPGQQSKKRVNRAQRIFWCFVCCLYSPDYR